MEWYVPKLDKTFYVVSIYQRRKILNLELVEL